jgi:uncharacterized membrane protein
MLAVIWLSAQAPTTTIIIEDETEEDLAAVGEIIESRCSMCHAAEPMWAGIASAPKGVLLETQTQIRHQARTIGLQAVFTHAMPPGNITGIEPAERQKLAAWIAAGAPAW